METAIQPLHDNKATLSILKPEDHSIVLKKYHISYETDGYYLRVGHPGQLKGWILHLSVLAAETVDLFNAVLPLLLYERAAFKVAATKEVAKAILNGQLGYTQLGKVMSIYSIDDAQAISLANSLILLTKSFRGPKILTDRHLGGIVYTRYGAFDNLNPAESPYCIPFTPPNGVAWPFSAIASATGPKPDTILRDRYRPMEILKEDARGNVTKSLRLVKWWKVKWCVIKEGRQHMFADDHGRDIRDRLLWQHEVHKKLENLFPIPKVYELFEENNDTYLALEFIKGKSLSKIIVETFRDRHWSFLDQKEQLLLIRYALELLDLIFRLHKAGYVHRDINPDNILFNKRLKLIDLELLFSINKQYPDPPFKWGTMWFMSPEQQAVELPTYKEDIYAIGATLIAILTGLLPNKFSAACPDALHAQLAFFVPSTSVVDVIVRCFAPNPASRPEIAILRNELTNFEQCVLNIKSPATLSKKLEKPDRQQLLETIQKAVQGISSPLLMGQGELWPSPTVQDDNLAYYQNESRDIYPGFSSGLSGICYVLSKAHRSGTTIRSCISAYNKSIQFISQSVQRTKAATSDLYSGTAGMAIALLEGIDAGLIPPDSFSMDQLFSGPDEQCTELGVAAGISGIGMALLRASGHLSTKTVRYQLENYVDALLEAQQPDGSWLIKQASGAANLKLTGFDHGAAGICCFLCGYADQYNDNLVKKAIARALRYLQKVALVHNKTTTWTLHEKTKASESSLVNGSIGVALAFITGYHVIDDASYRASAESGLRSFDRYLVGRDLSLAYGLTGLGEIYNDAYHLFNDEEWKDRRDWLTNLLLHQFQQQEDGGRYWLVNNSPFSNADLLNGNSGILHYLLRTQPNSRIGNPLLPFQQMPNNEMGT